MNWERIISGAAGAAIAALLGSLGIVAAAPTNPAVPSDQYALVVQHLARLQAQKIAEADRCACKYRVAATEGVSRGWTKPTTRAAWDEVCAPSDNE